MKPPKSLILSILILVLAAGTSSHAQIHDWSQSFGDGAQQEAEALSFDPSGNVIITGRFWGTVDFGGGALTAITGAGHSDIFVAKFDPSGAHLWSKRFGDQYLDWAESVAADQSGNILLTGRFQDTVDFGGGVLTSAGNNDIFVAKFDPDGNHVWSAAYGSSNNQEGWDIATDPLGNVIVSGYFKGTIDFGGGTLTEWYDWDVFLVKFNPNGLHIWSYSYGMAGSEGGYTVAVDDSANVILAGFFTEGIDFGGGLIDDMGSFDVYVAKFDSAGTHQWSKPFGDASDQRCWGVAVDDSLNVLLTGFFSGGIDFGGGTHTATGWDGFLAKLDSDGAYRWSKNFGNAGDLFAVEVAADGLGNVYNVGYFGGSADFGGGSLTSAGGNDVFLAKYAADGSHAYSGRYGDTDDQWGQSVAATGAGIVSITGSFQDSLDVGGGPLVAAGDTDIFLANFISPLPEPQISSIADVGNDQGRSVRIRFLRSDRDEAGSPTPILQYEAFRRIDALSTATQDLDTRTRSARDAGMRSDAALLGAGWEFAGAIPAHGDLDYSMVAPTLADSTDVGGMHWSVFFVRAATAAPLTYFDSAPDSGYSLDNLAPTAPLNLAFTSPGLLTWDEAGEEDFDFYTVYGSASPSLDGSAVLVDYTISPTLDVQTDPHEYYHVTVTDFAGNEGGASSVMNSLIGIHRETLPVAVGVRAFPNPFNPATTITYAVPKSGPVTLAVFDAKGRLVDTLVEGATRERGNYRIQYRLSAASGVYFVKIDAGGETATQKIVLLK
jgi:hypothetical protein